MDPAKGQIGVTPGGSNPIYSPKEKDSVQVGPTQNKVSGTVDRITLGTEKKGFLQSLKDRIRPGEVKRQERIEKNTALSAELDKKNAELVAERAALREVMKLLPRDGLQQDGLQQVENIKNFLKITNIVVDGKAVYDKTGKTNNEELRQIVAAIKSSAVNKTETPEKLLERVATQLKNRDKEFLAVNITTYGHALGLNIQ